MVILLLITTSGCAVLKKTGKKSEESYSNINTLTDHQQSYSAMKQKAGNELVYKRDSAEGNYTVRLWPKGTFNFSPDGGFSGELDSIVMKGKQNKVTSATTLSNTSELEKDQMAARNQQTKKIRSGNKKEEKVAVPDGKLILILVGIAGLAIYFTIKGRLFTKNKGF
ncbi:hypothetical protein SAMN06265348_12140 [Pedobacter westerhofensis]|uniref:Uncharacterized protein n=2 Tax=Pedobacter westerhofensis TaxID=425512 RepID=A0A521FSZ6_9SPHI|nr:hypothetical protein [Pedobacter westerhofensis]SMO99272.1 hypothetical protein SAMN06265348_12140 [Pedobacter westerhofensis]